MSSFWLINKDHNVCLRQFAGLHVMTLLSVTTNTHRAVVAILYCKNLKKLKMYKKLKLCVITIY